jgi:hypothetical protein
MFLKHLPQTDMQTVSSEIHQSHPVFFYRENKRHEKISNGKRTINTAHRLYHHYPPIIKVLLTNHGIRRTLHSSNGVGKRKSAAGNTRSTAVGMTKQARPNQKSKLEIKHSNMLGREAVELPLSLIQAD